MMYLKKLSIKACSMLVTIALLLGIEAIFVIAIGNTNDFIVQASGMNNEINLSIALGNDATGTGWVYSNQVYTILDGADVIVSGDASDSNRRIAIANGATAKVTLNGAKLDVDAGNDIPAILVNDGSKLTLALADGTTNIVKVHGSWASGIQLWSNTKLVIEGKGSLEAYGGTRWPAIGGRGRNDGSSRTIIINDGNIKAYGGAEAAGIGEGRRTQYNTSIIEINGGTIYSEGGSSAAGIGGGDNQYSGQLSGGANIKITGGTIKAIGKDGSDGIGKGVNNQFNANYNIKGNAFIDANGFSGVSDTQKENWSGVVLDGNAGKVYGNPILYVDSMIFLGKTLTVDAGKTLTIAKGTNLTNNGAIINNGTIINEGTIDGTGTSEGNKYKFTLDAPTLKRKTDGSVTLNTVIPSQISGAVKYGYAKTNDESEVKNWQNSETFDNLKGNTEYYFFVKVEESTTYFSTVSIGASIKTDKKMHSVTSGDNEEWVKGSSKDLIIVSDADIIDFENIVVDENILDTENYVVKAGSTIVTIKKSFLETLKDGKHTVEINSKTGSATTSITILAKSSQNGTDGTINFESPNTGDSTSAKMMFILGMGSIGMIIFILKRKNKINQ